MAINLGLSDGEMDRLKRLLVSNHRISITVQLMDLNHNYLAEISHMLIGGQVDIDADASESTRSATMEFLDPKKQLALDGEAPEDGSMYYTKMVKIIYSVISVDRQHRFDIPLFCGPLSRVERNGVIVSVSALGKEKLAMSIVYRGKTYKAKAKKAHVIRDILTEIGGEKNKKIHIQGTIKGTLPKKLVVDHDTTAWKAAKKVSKTTGRFLFYDARGVCHLRFKTKKVHFEFREKGAMLSEPAVAFDAESVVNCVYVIGGKVGPKGKKKTLRYKVAARKKHPLSPWRMGRNGNPRFLPEIIQDSNIKSKKTAKRIAKARLKQLLEQRVEVAFDSLPIPFLEENDYCKVVSTQYTGHFRLTKMSIPLSADGRSSIGYLRNVKPNRRQVKIKSTSRNRKNRPAA